MTVITSLYNTLFCCLSNNGHWPIMSNVHADLTSVLVIFNELERPGGLCNALECPVYYVACRARVRYKLQAIKWGDMNPCSAVLIIEHCASHILLQGCIIR